VKTVTLPVGRPSRRQQGFTYLLILVALVIVGILAEAGVLLNSRIVKANKEQELLFRGRAYQEAIRSYYFAGATREYPRSLEMLLNDPRYQHKRHIRQLYTDPITNQPWLLLKDSRGGITGIASSSREVPLKRANFPEEFVRFTGAAGYQEWVFEFRPKPLNKKNKT